MNARLEACECVFTGDNCQLVRNDVADFGAACVARVPIGFDFEGLAWCTCLKFFDAWQLCFFTLCFSESNPVSSRNLAKEKPPEWWGVLSWVVNPSADGRTLCRSAAV